MHNSLATSKEYFITCRDQVSEVFVREKQASVKFNTLARPRDVGTLLRVSNLIEFALFFRLLLLFVISFMMLKPNVNFLTMYALAETKVGRGQQINQSVITSWRICTLSVNTFPSM